MSLVDREFAHVEDIEESLDRNRKDVEFVLVVAFRWHRHFCEAEFGKIWRWDTKLSLM